MVLAAIVACEIGFWVVLGGGLLARYALGRPRLGAVLLLCVPLVDLALLAFTVVDLRAGTPASSAHGLAAVYLGVSVVFGHSWVRSADTRAAHRWAGGPRPEPRPASGTPERLRLEWRDFGRGCAAVAVSAVLLVAAVLLVGERADTRALEEWLVRLVVVLVVWLVGWPLWETARQAARPRDGSEQSRSSAAVRE